MTSAPAADSAADPLAAVAALPGVAEAVTRAREACEELRWHEAFRRRSAEVRAAASVRQARASAALEGADLPEAALRALAVGGPEGEPGSPATGVARGVLRAEALVERWLPALGSGATRPGRRGPARPALPQTLARLHLATGEGWLAEDDLGRVRTGDEVADLRGLGPAPAGDRVAARLALLAEVLGATRAPGLVVAAVAHGELLALRPFRAGTGPVARAVERLLLTETGVDPTGTVLAAVPRAARPQPYLAAAAGFATGEPERVAAWVTGCADAVVAGAQAARTLADEVLAG